MVLLVGEGDVPSAKRWHPAEKRDPEVRVAQPRNDVLDVRLVREVKQLELLGPRVPVDDGHAVLCTDQAGLPDQVTGPEVVVLAGARQADPVDPDVRAVDVTVNIRVSQYLAGIPHRDHFLDPVVEVFDLGVGLLTIEQV